MLHLDTTSKAQPRTPLVIVVPNIHRPSPRPCRRAPLLLLLLPLLLPQRLQPRCVLLPLGRPALVVALLTRLTDHLGARSAAATSGPTTVSC